ncbi:hypothetical protein [Ectobacillus funiculus]|uniref:hypothetical protein n=1 Tax=Ectobacillus funiculus TaxID=137993 RepID=UPI00101C1899|nr:hypothetical protein [Ectobacillus funiculus]
MKITIPVRRIKFVSEEKERWVRGERSDCIDPYCRNYPGSYGFGEALVGKYFERQGYRWIHHDFNVFGGNRLGKYPIAEQVIRNCIGADKYEAIRSLYTVYKSVEEPDLLIYKPDFSEIRFAESKRVDTRDKLRESQIRGIALLSLLFQCEVEVFEIVQEGKIIHAPDEIVWDFGKRE